ncbi:hypothetical protein HDU76_004167 [Blyttiomyces sp. JEL0837]|nr:hypothetical protein HDU76_004167 [Blyttiomyces sp. JEL0837]
MYSRRHSLMGRRFSNDFGSNKHHHEVTVTETLEKVLPDWMQAQLQKRRASTTVASRRGSVANSNSASRRSSAVSITGSSTDSLPGDREGHVSSGMKVGKAALVAEPECIEEETGF